MVPHVQKGIADPTNVRIRGPWDVAERIRNLNLRILLPIEILLTEKPKVHRHLMQVLVISPRLSTKYSLVLNVIELTSKYLAG